MSHDRFITVLLDIIIDFFRGALSSTEVLTAITNLVRSRGDYQLAPNSELEHILFETVVALPAEAAQLFVIAAPLVLEGLTACEYGTDDCELYERHAAAMEAALLDVHLDGNDFILSVLATLFPYEQYTFVGTLIPQILLTCNHSC